LKSVTLVLGGARSGKSTFALEVARRNAARVLFVATATAGDEDMRRRIEKHRKERPAGWRTLEAPDHLGKRIAAGAADAELVIVDCITLLVNNIFGRYPDDEFETLEESVLEKDVQGEIAELETCLKNCPASFIVISNEVGLGIVPETRIGRLYRDILGRANQRLAAASDAVYLLVAGIPLRLKGPAKGL
jgi:adenosylcobinamide kinase / adenosylcobinamide-phosphate guanylyltransferase